MINLSKFKLSAASHYIENLIRLAAGLPAKDYPPANIAAWIKICKGKGRDDLGKKIMMQWNAVVDKYPAVRVNWGAAVKISGHSIKKNVFGHQEFEHWLQAELDVPHAEAAQLAHSVPAAPVDHHPIEVPADDETPEDWQHAAKKTAALLVQIEEGLNDSVAFIAHCESQIKEKDDSIKKYGPGGEKSKNKDGSPAKLSERVPKWEAQKAEFMKALEATKKAVEKEKGVRDGLQKQYDNKRITTVQYENHVQTALEDTLSFILQNVKDSEKQKKMLLELNKLMKNMDEGSSKAASVNKTGAFWDKFIDAFDSIFDYLKEAASSLLDWAKGLAGHFSKVDSAINPF